MSEWNGWDQGEMGKQLVMSFDGDALKLLGELNDDILSEYTYLYKN